MSMHSTYCSPDGDNSEDKPKEINQEQVDPEEKAQELIRRQREHLERSLHMLREKTNREKQKQKNDYRSLFHNLLVVTVTI